MGMLNSASVLRQECALIYQHEAPASVCPIDCLDPLAGASCWYVNYATVASLCGSFTSGLVVTQAAASIQATTLYIHHQRTPCHFAIWLSS